MLFYVALGGLFSLYGLDLLLLVVISAIARAAEIRAAMARKREAKKREKASQKDAVCAKFAFGNESMLSGAGTIHTKVDKPLKTASAATADQHAEGRTTSPASPPSTPLAAAGPVPKQRLHSNFSNASSCSELALASPAEDAVTAAAAAATTSPAATEVTPPAAVEQQLPRCTVVAHHRCHSTGSTVGSSASPAAPSMGSSSTVGTSEQLLPPGPYLAAGPAAQHPFAPPAPSAPLPADMYGAGAAFVPGRLNSIPSIASSVLTDATRDGMGGGSLMLCSLGDGGRALCGRPGSGCSWPGSSTAGSQSIPPELLEEEVALEAPQAAPKLKKGAPQFCVHTAGAEGGDQWPLPLEQYPLVLIQLPMFNEEAHCALVVERCCEIAWPRTRLLIQVLDDSTKSHIREKVDAAAVACMEKGHPVQVLRRTNRQGYKAGAMVEGLAHVAALGFKYAAIFDADFEPPKDFLLETIGPLEADNKLGFVQTRWLNPSKSFLTWAQKVNLGFHFDVEQRARSFMGWFFNFNGTAGVWRIEAIETSGGWQSDTVVEDMDLSLRAYLTGWRGLYMPHVGCSNEVPDDLSTYKTQQYRWLCGPMQILSKAFLTIWRADNVPLRLRLNCYWFFARYILFAVITLSVLAVPPVALWLDPWTWNWATIYFCVAVNFALAVYLYITPFSIAFLLFSVAVGYFKAWAMLGGLFGSKKSKSWKVTAKKGAQAEEQTLWQRIKGTLTNIGWPYALEFCLALYYGAIAALAFIGLGLAAGPSWIMGAYCAGMSFIFLVLSFGDAFL